MIFNASSTTLFDIWTLISLPWPWDTITHLTAWHNLQKENCLLVSRGNFPHRAVWFSQNLSSSSNAFHKTSIFWINLLLLLLFKILLSNFPKCEVLLTVKGESPAYTGINQPFGSCVEVSHFTCLFVLFWSVGNISKEGWEWLCASVTHKIHPTPSSLYSSNYWLHTCFPL